LNGVKVVRFRAEPRRRPWDEILKWSSGMVPRSVGLAHAWARTQGPVSMRLVEHLPEEASSRDLLIFFHLLLHQTFVGLPRVAKKSALVPLVHDETPVYSELARRTLATPSALLINTVEEGERIARIVRGALPPMGVVAVGRETPTEARREFAPPRKPYLVVMGRLGKSKSLLATWRALMSRNDWPPLEYEGQKIPWSQVSLVTVGQRSSAYESLPNVVALGFVSDEDRWDILRHAMALLNPSIYESLSLVLLEAWTVSLPVLVNSACDVTVGQCRRSEGGLAIEFADPKRAAEAIVHGLASESARRTMGASGAAYVERNYVWDVVLDRYERVARAVAAGGDVAGGSHAVTCRRPNHPPRAQEPGLTHPT